MKGERTIVPGSWRLGGPRSPWPTAATNRITVADTLTLAPTPDGPHSLRSANGTLGGLVLPPTLAADTGLIWLLDRRLAVLRQFDPLLAQFVTVPGWGRLSSGAQRFGARTVLAATGGLLALADPHRGDLVVASSRPLVVRSVLAVPGTGAVAVVGWTGTFYVLDARGGLWRTSPLLGRLVREDDPGRLPEGAWRRLAVDSSGRPWRVDDVAGTLLSVTGGHWEQTRSAEAVRGRFASPAVEVDRAGRFRVPSAYRLTGTAAPTSARLGLGSHVDAGAGQWFDPSGDPCTVLPDESAGRPPYHGEGSWTGRSLDSGVLGCRWHRVTLWGEFPPGSMAMVQTYSSDDRVEAEDVPPDAWSPVHRVTGLAGGRETPMTPVEAAMENPRGWRRTRTDLAVLAPRGRHLMLRIGLTGDGWASPSVTSLLVEPQAAGLERFLPAVYRSDDQTTDFLHRFLSIFGTELDEVEQSLRSLPTRFSPATVPAEWLDALAAELGVPLERGWTAEQRRSLLEVAPSWHRRRGTPAAVTALLRAHLEASSGRQLPAEVPVLVEGFRERPASLLGSTRLPMGAGERTWSDEVVGRPVLGSRRARRINLVSAGDRLTDRFRVHANRFTVVVPRPLLPGPDDLARFERMVAAEAPAHVAHEVLLVEPRAVVGEQGMVGVDTVVGDWPVARLTTELCRGDRLGLGLRLVRRGSATPSPLGRRGGRSGGTWLGVGSVLT